MSRGRLVAYAAAPVAALLIVRLLGEGNASGLFRADAAALAVTATLWAFVAEPAPRRLGVLVLAAVVLVPVHALLGGGFGGGLHLAALALGVGAGAGGIAVLGRRLGAPRVGAGVVATAVLVLAMVGLFWADPVGDRLPHAKRFAFKQAVLHLDAATAAAYDAAAFDRFHEPRVYAEVPLVTEAVRAPTALPTAAR